MAVVQLLVIGAILWLVKSRNLEHASIEGRGETGFEEEEAADAPLLVFSTVGELSRHRA